MNTMPEWFTVEPENKYVLKDVTTGSRMQYTGKQLHEGVPIEIAAGAEQRLQLRMLKN